MKTIYKPLFDLTNRKVFFSDDGYAYFLDDDANLVGAPYTTNFAIEVDNATYVEDFDTPLRPSIIKMYKWELGL